MPKLPGRLKMGLMTCCVAVTIFILYKTFGEATILDTYQKEVYPIDDKNRHLPLPMDPVLKKLNSVQGDDTRYGDNEGRYGPLAKGNAKLEGSSQDLPDDSWSRVAHENWLPVNIGQSSMNNVLKQRLVHLDLKGAPPKVEYYQKLFPLLYKLGATGLLLEYEDMFPFWDQLSGIHATNSYLLGNIQQILHLAKVNNLEVIPLVQTFGHMEFILKLEEFRHLRELPGYPQAICPSRNQTGALIKALIDQVVEVHRGIRYLHIGCDEVYHYGECTQCMERMTTANWNREDLFLDHVKFVASYVKNMHKIQPIMWDDMFRSIPEQIILSSGVGKYVDILVWKYDKDITLELPPEIWSKYASCFDGVWIGSAFKGATGPAQYATQVLHHLENHMSWMQVIDMYHDKISFKGIVVTGWQRYDHFAVLCELLPSGIPSLAVNLLYLQFLKVDQTLMARVQEILGCNHVPPLDLNVTGDTIQCSFPGSKVYENILQFLGINYELDQMFNSNIVKGWMSDINVQTGYSSPAYIEQAVLRLNEAWRNVSFFRVEMESSMSEVYDQYTVAEWTETYVRPLLKKLDDLEMRVKKLTEQNVWPRRPVAIPNARPIQLNNDVDHAVSTVV